MTQQNTFDYPETARADTVDTLHGIQVPDPYRWLEEIDSDQTQAWIAEQNRLTFDYLSQIPARDRIATRIAELWNYEKYDPPFKRGGRYFFTRNDGLQNQSVLYWMESLEGEPRVLLDPNLLSADGTVALTNHAISDDGNLLAYGLSAAGSDWQEWRVREVDSGRDLDDHLEWVKFSEASWTPDNQGFYYSRYDEPEEGTEYKGANYYHKLYYHRIGTPQAADELVYERPDQKEWGFGGHVTEDGRYLLIYVWIGTHRENGIFYQDLKAENGPVVELLAEFDALYDIVGNDGPVLYCLTDLDAPMSRVIAIDVTQPDRANWREVIAESEDALETVNLIGERFVATYLHDAHSRVAIYDKTGHTVREVGLPGIGTVIGFAGRQADSETFYLFSGFATPGTVYHYDVTTGKTAVFRQPKIGFDPGSYVTGQVFYPSKDGTLIPMFISHKKGLEIDGDTPTFLYGYGGFNIAVPPYFQVANLVWMEMGVRQRAKIKASL
ncbi:MAG: prolyl oligopeptidase family serine peptidase, partial [Anaerolineales bacterium]